MANQRLQHYLRTYRRRSGFSQAEIALLLGASSATKVSRYERFSRHPSVAAVFAYEIIFDQPVKYLFAGRYDAVRRDIRARAQQLMEKIETGSDTPQTSLKLKRLRAILEAARDHCS